MSSDIKDIKQKAYEMAIIDEAEQVFADQGFAATGMRDIATAASVSAKTLYGYFSGKLELYQRICELRGEQILATVEQRVQANKQDNINSPLKVMLSGIASYMRFFHDHPHYTRLLLNEGHLRMGAQPALSDAQEQQWQRGEMLSHSAVQRGIDLGEFIQEPVTELAAMMNSLLQIRLANWVRSGMQLDAAALAGKAQAEFVRAFCPPAVARTLLSEDGLQLVDHVRA